jgi:CRP/FNR family cyclic AMP-dependent transcriptional regulator
VLFKVLLIRFSLNVGLMILECGQFIILESNYPKFKMILEPMRVVELFITSPNIQTFKAGETVFKVGETGEVMYGIVEGEVELWVKEEVFETIKTGDVFGEGALLQIPHSRASTAKAKTDCRLAVLDKEHFLFLVQETPLFALEVLRSLSSRLRAHK